MSYFIIIETVTLNARVKSSKIVIKVSPLLAMIERKKEEK